MSLLSPSVVAAIDDLELAARVVVEGLRVGGHRSPFHGYGAEFQQYRPYRAGDDLKYLDWKAFARSNRLYTRQFRETTNLAVMIVIDASASMAFPPTGITKLRYGAILAASLAYLVADQGNAVGLMTREAGEFAYLPARAGRPHMRAVIGRLDRLRGESTWNGPETIRRGAELLSRRGLLVVISDFYDDEEETRRELRHVVQRGHDVTMLQLLSPDEQKFSLTGQLELRDLETSSQVLVDARALAPEYDRRMQEFLARCRDGAARDGVDYALMRTDTPPERAMRDYLVRRGTAR